MGLLTDILIVFALSIPVLFLCNRIRIPAIVGLLLTGIVVGPQVLALIDTRHEVEILSELGVVLLLFTIGMEFSMKKLMNIKKSVLLGGTLQVGITIAAAALLAYLFGSSTGSSIYFGFIVSLSSTAIVLKSIQENAQMDSPMGRTSLAILIYQDIIVVPFMLLTPVLAGTGSSDQSLPMLLLKGAGIIVIVIIGARFVVPALLYQIARTRSRELFLLSIITLGLSVAWATHAAGLSLSLGAFLAGLIISETEYSHEAIGSIIPFKDVFTSIFFISIGMLLDLEALVRYLPTVAAVTAGIIIMKTMISSLAAFSLGLPLSVCLVIGLALSQVGEFSFILLKTGSTAGLVPDAYYQIALSSIIMTMMLTPFIMKGALKIPHLMEKAPLPERLKQGLYRDKSQPAEDAFADLENHVIIVGHGVNGKNVSRAALSAGIPHVVIEMNPDTVKREQQRGIRIIYGDATHEAVLEHVKIKSARVLVVTIPDPAAVMRIIAAAKRMNPSVYIIARTRFVQEVERLYKLGADEVIPEEFETSVEIFTRVMKKYLVPQNEVVRFIEEIRSEGYRMFRTMSDSSGHEMPDIIRKFHGLDFITCLVEEGSPAAGKTLEELNLRKSYGVTAAAIYREDGTIYNPQGVDRLLAGDILLVLGHYASLSDAMAAFKGKPPE